MNKTWTVLIVDDEIRIGMLIQKLIRWDELPLSCVSVLDNSEAALAQILEERPDIVVTDIRMPKIDGLALIERVKQQLPDTRFIVVSGHKEFEYAQKALKHSVRDYLLKPINQEELNRALSGICAELSQETAVLEHTQALQRTATASERIIRTNLLASILSTDRLPPLDGMRRTASLTLDAGCLRGLVIKIDNRDTERADEKVDRMVADKILASLDDAFDSCTADKLLCERENLYIYCLLCYHPASAKEVKEHVSELMTDLQDYLMGFDQHDLTIGLGTQKEQYRDVLMTLREARAAVDWRIRSGTGRILRAKHLSLDADFSAEEFLRPHRTALIQAVETFSESALSDVLAAIFDADSLPDTFDYSHFYEIARRVVALFFEGVDPKNSESEALRQRLPGLIAHCTSLPQLRALLTGTLGQYLAMCLQLLATESVKPVREAKRYIDEHYSEKIGLEEIAEIVGLSPAYFSVLFKKETGLNISAYIVNVRMDSAKRMIRETNETISAIAERVGYKDTRYFSQLFAKSVGIKPALYRKLHA